MIQEDQKQSTPTEETNETPQNQSQESEVSEKDINAVSEGMEQQTQNKKPDSKTQAYVAGLMKLMHSKQTSKVVDQMLQAEPPEQSIPRTALFLEDQMERSITKKAPMPSLDTIFVAGQYLVTDLIEVGNTAKWWDIQDPEQIKSLFQDTFQQYIEKGLHEGTIDPIELQKKAESLMPPEQRQHGLNAASMAGIPHEPDEFTAMASYGHQRERQGMMKGQQQQPQGVLNNGS